MVRRIAEILARHPDIELEWDMIAALPGASTDPENWIIRSAIRAWEDVEGKPHPAPPWTSGQTDISMIRSLGIPTFASRPISPSRAASWFI